MKPGFLISQFFITFILLSSLACVVEVGGVFDDSFLAISFFEDLSQAFSLGAVDELMRYDVGECGSEGYAQYSGYMSSLFFEEIYCFFLKKCNLNTPPGKSIFLNIFQRSIFLFQRYHYFVIGIQLMFIQ